MNYDDIQRGKIGTLAKEALRKRRFIKDEEEGINEYKKAIKESKGKEKEVYKAILPQEQEHLSKLKNL
jgi:rubrerythrin